MKHITSWPGRKKLHGIYKETRLQAFKWRPTALKGLAAYSKQLCSLLQINHRHTSIMGDGRMRKSVKFTGLIHHSLNVSYFSSITVWPLLLVSSTIIFSSSGSRTWGADSLREPVVKINYKMSNSKILLGHFKDYYFIHCMTKVYQFPFPPSLHTHKLLTRF